MLALPRLPPLAAAACRRGLALQPARKAGKCLGRSRPGLTRVRLSVRAVAVEPDEATGKVSSEAEEVARLAAGAGDIYGIPRTEWLALQSPARYLGNEWGAINKQWSSASVRFTLAYPEMYEVGASNLGHIVLYTVLNETDGLLCDRSYLPAPDMQGLLARHGKSLFAVESKRPLRDFDTIGLSLAYELSCTNMLQMIHLSDIPLTWEERLQRDGDRPWSVEGGSLPLIFAGGPTATSNPEPFASFCDYFALGDGEDCLPEIGKCLMAAKAAGLSRRDTLLKLAREVKGVYVPMFYDSPEGWGGAVFPTADGVPARVVRRVAAPDPSKQIGLVPFVATIHDRLTIEIRRGCTRGCRFCQPGMLTRPARDVEPEAVIKAVEEGVRKTGYTDFSLLSLSCSDYLALPAVGIELRNRLKGERISLQLPSQRVDRFDENIANIMGGSRASPSITFAPEAGTQRMRDIINKGLTNEELLRGVVTAYDKGWRSVKLYFMIGLPGETDADVLGIAETVMWLQKECRGRGGPKERLRVSVTISNFTPKPHTPFQWHTVSTAEFDRKQKILRERFREARDCKVNYTPTRISAMEDFIGRGDRRLGTVIRRAWELGACNEAWWEGTDQAFSAWDKAITEGEMTWKYRQVADGEWDVLGAIGDGRFRGQGGGGKGRLDRGPLGDSRLDAPLPWDHVDTGISRAWLKADLQRALEAVTVPDCSHSVCSECGVCGDEFGENVVVEPPPVPAFDGAFSPATTKAQRLRLRFTKRGDLVFVGHLDLMKMFERAIRRAALPVSQDGSPFHSRPVLASALALGLGYTSSGEVLELQLTHRVDPEEVRERLSAALPDGTDLSVVGEFTVKSRPGVSVMTMGQAITHSDFLVLLAPGAGGAGGGGVDDDEDAEEKSEDDGEGGASSSRGSGGGGGAAAPSGGQEEDSGRAATAVAAGPSGQQQQQTQPAAADPNLPPPTAADFRAWVEKALALPEYVVEKRSKSNPKKVAAVDLRPTLLAAHVCGSPAGGELRAEGDAAGAVILDAHLPSPLPDGSAVVRFRSAFTPEVLQRGGLLGPEQFASLLSSVAGRPLEVRYVHRAAIGFRDEAVNADEAAEAAQAVIDAEAAARARVALIRALEDAAIEEWKKAGAKYRTTSASSPQKAGAGGGGRRGGGRGGGRR